MGGTTKAIVHTLPRGVGIGCLQVLMEWVEWMWRVALSLPTVGTSPGVRTGQALFSQNRDGYEVEQCGQAGSRSEVWLHASVLRGCEAGCEVLEDHGAGSGQHEDRQSRRCRAPIVGLAAVRP